MSKTTIEWTDATWNPIRGVKGRWHCTHISEGCRHCYAERLNVRWGGPAYKPGADTFRLDERILEQPLRWKKPRKIFVCDMTDLFHEEIPDAWIVAIFGIMAASQQHTFQVLTKRPERMQAWYAWLSKQGGIGPYIRSIRVDGDRTLPNLFACKTTIVRGKKYRASDDAWIQVFNAAATIGSGPLHNLWLGVSVEDQATADERIPLLLQTPATVIFVSYEPALSGVDFSRWLPIAARGNRWERVKNVAAYGESRSRISWIIAGGESGPKARPCDLAWIRSVVQQCQVAETSVFVKQVGALVLEGPVGTAEGVRVQKAWRPSHPKGGAMEEWPEDLRVREFPEVTP